MTLGQRSATTMGDGMDATAAAGASFQRRDSPGPAAAGHLVAFVAYAREDGDTFANQLVERLPDLGVTPFVDWMLPGGEIVGPPLERALEGCQVFLFVMTLGSIRDDRWPRLELNKAFDLCLPRLVLQVGDDHPDLKPPLEVMGIPPIHFSGRRAAAEGWTELERQLRAQASPAVRAEWIERRISRLRERARASGDPDAWQRVISQQEDALAEIRQRAEDPQAAVRRQRQQVDLAKERERQPEQIDDPVDPIRVGRPPALPSGRFRDRTDLQEDLELRLAEPDIKLIAVSGESEGIGKTAMIGKVWERIVQRQTAVHADGLIYLTAHGVFPVTAEAVIDALRRMVPSPERGARLDERLRRPLPWTEKLLAVLAVLGRRRVILVIDAVEELLDEDRDLADLALREVIDQCLWRPGHRVTVLLAGRRIPVPLRERHRTVTYARRLVDGLPDDDGYELLNRLDTDGRYHLGPATPAQRRQLKELTGGSPRAVELAFALLDEADGADLGWLLETMRQLRQEADTRDDMVTVLFRRAFAKLDDNEKQIVQALAIYGRPMPPSAVDDLLADYVPGLTSLPFLKDLHESRLVRREVDHFYLPPTPESRYVLTTIPRDRARSGGSTPQFTQAALLSRAIAWFVSVRHRAPRRVNELQAQLNEIDLRLRAGDGDGAYDLMAFLANEYLLKWGASSVLARPLQTLLEASGLSTELRLHTLSLLALVEGKDEHYERAGNHAREALGLARGPLAANRSVLRRQLAHICNQLGDLPEATALSRIARRSAVRNWPPRGAARAYSDSALYTAYSGDFEGALRQLRVAEAIWRVRLPDDERRQHTILLINRAWMYGRLGRYDRARVSLDRAFNQAAQLDDHQSVARCRLIEAQIMLDRRQPKPAMDTAKQAAEAGLQGGDRVLIRETQQVLALAALCLGDLGTAAAAADIAGRHRPSVWGHVLAGVVAFRRDGTVGEAVEHFDAADALGARLRPLRMRDYDFLDSHALAACGLALLGRGEYDARAVDRYGQARALTSAEGVVARNQLLLDQFGERADQGRLDRFRSAARGAVTSQ
jgi:tetratricopeptide (TPR) repeat protein